MEQIGGLQLSRITNATSALEYVFPSEQKPIGILKRTEMITETGG